MYIKDLYIFVEGPDDDSNEIETCRPSPINCKVSVYFVEGLDDDSSGIETCRPSPINNILMIVVFD